MPPAMRTFPFVSRVAVCETRGIVMEPVGPNVPGVWAEIACVRIRLASAAVSFIAILNLLDITANLYFESRTYPIGVGGETGGGRRRDGRFRGGRGEAQAMEDEPAEPGQCGNRHSGGVDRIRYG